VTPLEEIGFGHRQTSEEDSGSGQSTIIDKGHLFLQHNQKDGRDFCYGQA